MQCNSFEEEQTACWYPNTDHNVSHQLGSADAEDLRPGASNDNWQVSAKCIVLVVHTVLHF